MGQARWVMRWSRQGMAALGSFTHRVIHITSGRQTHERTYKMKISVTTEAHIPDIQAILSETELFPPEMLPEMIDPFLEQQTQDQIWLTCLVAKTPVGFCFADPEAMTDGTYNMRAIAVAPAEQGKGYGAALTGALEDALTQLGQRLLLVDTSGTDDFAKTRRFYAHNGYAEEARIRNYWADGDDKIVLSKSLSGQS